ncbi:DUF423 domain-containing protein [Colwellia psychrerythraea]|uniref:DUF423 domain-containing protein n=1 Tax=Colwellia psychrerythraea TaxID=28229 RepID=A0A099KR26_COLPS|nr:DUF423 domain-containing protein [Colwellia psychrerythraea]KGJ92976.1 protein of unknown function DUF423 [Colwellia psychrerythraea]
MNSTNIDQQPEINLSRMAVLLKCMMISVGISGCFSVLFGAWLAHGGQALPVNVQSSLATALQYQFIHTLALFATLVWLKSTKPSKALIGASIAFVIGLLCFCGTIYIKSFFELAFIGKLTPFGGISFALAWLLLALEGKNNF